GNVSGAGLRVTTGVVVGEDDGGRIDVEHGLDDLAGVDAGGIDGAVEQPFKAEYAMLGIEQDHSEDFALLSGQLDAQVITYQRRAGQIVTALEAGFEDRSGPLQDFVFR